MLLSHPKGNHVHMERRGGLALSEETGCDRELVFICDETCPVPAALEGRISQRPADSVLNDAEQMNRDVVCGERRRM
ncbi:hypothetical protein QQF64_031364 [Cirrhinus molitorella]|uniref:Uncharacterized protein n=1 Tax=Cirrhinus molitorella TaxID=172907 RepID=A0ABR3MWQ6_9TELE